MTEKAFKTTEINSTLIKSKQLLNFEHLLNTIKLTGPGPASHRNHLTLNALPKAPFRLAKQPISQAQTAHLASPNSPSRKPKQPIPQAQTAHTAAHGATARNQAGCTPHNITHADFHVQAGLQPACILLRVCYPRHARLFTSPGHRPGHGSWRVANPPERGRCVGHRGNPLTHVNFHIDFHVNFHVKPGIL